MWRRTAAARLHPPDSLTQSLRFPYGHPRGAPGANEVADVKDKREHTARTDDETRNIVRNSDEARRSPGTRPRLKPTQSAIIHHHSPDVLGGPARLVGHSGRTGRRRLPRRSIWYLWTIRMIENRGTHDTCRELMYLMRDCVNPCNFSRITYED